MTREEYETHLLLENTYLSCGECGCPYNYMGYCTSDVMNEAGLCVMDENIY